MLIGYKSNSYPNKRNIIGIVGDAEYKRVWDLFALPNAMARGLNYITKRAATQE